MNRQFLLWRGQGEWGGFEDLLLEELRSRQTPVIVVCNQSDLGVPTPVSVTYHPITWSEGEEIKI